MISASPGGTILNVRVIPRARRAELAGVRNDALLVRLVAPPIDGAANTELVDLLSRVLAVPKRAITIVSGERSRTKRMRLSGVDATVVAMRLAAISSAE